jgi:ankyrin repeat protein
LQEIPPDLLQPELINSTASSWGLTPLHVAAAAHNAAAVQQLLRAGANPNTSTDSGLVPLHFAAISSFFPDLAAGLDLDQDALSDDELTVHDTPQQFDANAAADSLYSFLKASSAGNTLYNMQLLLQKLDKARRPGGSIAVAKLLLAAGANANGSTAAAAAPAPAGAFVFGSSSSSSSSSSGSGRLITPLHLAACCVVPGDFLVGADSAAERIVAAAADAGGWDAEAAEAAADGAKEGASLLTFSHRAVDEHDECKHQQQDDGNEQAREKQQNLQLLQQQVDAQQQQQQEQQQQEEPANSPQQLKQLQQKQKNDMKALQSAQRHVKKATDNLAETLANLNGLLTDCHGVKDLAQELLQQTQQLTQQTKQKQEQGEEQSQQQQEETLNQLAEQQQQQAAAHSEEQQEGDGMQAAEQLSASSQASYTRCRSEQSSSSSIADDAAYLTAAEEHAAVILALRLAADMNPNALASTVEETPLTLAAWNCACVSAAALMYEGASTGDNEEEQQQQPIQLLQQQAANPNLPRKDGSRPIDLAARQGYSAFVLLLLQHGAIALPERQQRIHKQDAATAAGSTSSSRSSSSRAVISTGSSNSEASHQAYQQLMVDMIASSTKVREEDVTRAVQLLLKQGFPVDVVSRKGGGTALCSACVIGFTEVRFWVSGL